MKKATSQICLISSIQGKSAIDCLRQVGAELKYDLCMCVCVCVHVCVRACMCVFWQTYINLYPAVLLFAYVFSFLV